MAGQYKMQGKGQSGASADLVRLQDVAIAAAEAATGQNPRCEGVKQRKKRVRQEAAAGEFPTHACSPS